ncbi:MAG: hypothetical protein ABL908_17825, partial [Hyphomicrobium sp.]
PLRSAGAIVGEGVGALLGRPPVARPHSVGAQASPIMASPTIATPAATPPAVLMLGWSVLRDGSSALLGRSTKPATASPSVAIPAAATVAAAPVVIAPVVAAPVAAESIAPAPAATPAPAGAASSGAVVPPPMADALATTTVTPASTEARVSVADIAARAAKLAADHAEQPRAAAAPAAPSAAASAVAPAKATPPKQMAERRMPDAVRSEPMISSDNLSAINGIGPAIAKILHTLGVTRTSDIARWSEADLDATEATRRFKGRIVRDNWIGQARQLEVRHLSSRTGASTTGIPSAGSDTTTVAGSDTTTVAGSDTTTVPAKTAKRPSAKSGKTRTETEG